MSDHTKKPDPQDKSGRGGEVSRPGKLDYRTIFDAASNAMAFTEADSGKIIDVNAAWLTATGFVREKVIGKTALELGVWPDSAERATCLADLRSKRSLSDFEADLCLKSVRIPHLVSARMVEMDGECYILWEFRDLSLQKLSVARVKALLSRSEQSRRLLLSMLQDVKLAEEARKASETQVKYLLNAADCLVWQAKVTRRKTGELDWNYYIPPSGLYRRLFGIDPGEPPVLLWQEIGVFELDEMHSRCFQALTSGAPGYTQEFHAVIGGQIIWLREQVSVVARENESTWSLVGVITDITERKRADEALTMSEVRYRRLFEAARDGILILDAENGMVVDVNPFLIEKLGFSREVFLGKKVWELGFFKDIFTNQANFSELQKKEYIRYENLPLETANGQRLEVEFVSNVYQVNHHKVIQCNIRDITERKQAEAAAKENQERLALALQGGDLGTWDWNVQTGAVSFDDRWAQMLGYKVQELEPDVRTWESFVHPDDMPHVREMLNAHLEGHTAFYETEHRLRHQSGSWVWVLDKGKVITRDAAGKALRAAGTHLDITDRKLAGEKLRLRESFLSAITENQPGLLWLKDTEGRFLMVNKAFAAACGRSAPEHVQGLTDLDIWPKELADKYRHDDQQMMAAGNAIVVEEMIFIGNSHVWFETFKTPVRDDKGGVIGTTGFARDITERKRVEERIREQAALLDAANDAIYVRALDHTVTYWNDAAERLYGWPRAEALERTIIELGKMDPTAFKEAHETLLELGHWSGELKAASKSGREFVAFCRWTMLRDEQNQPKEILAINTDITERKQLEANFLRAQRLEGIGALAGGIAHDLNNILQPILITAPLLRETIDDPESRSLLDTVETSAQRGADIIKQLLTFARGTPGVRVPLPVRHLMSDMDKIIRETFPRNLKLTVDAPKDLWPVLGDATQIHQALMNLCVNARDAMPNGGILTLAAKNLTLDETFGAVMPEAKPGAYICVSVTDTGTGIPPEHLDRIFDPFFTTKEIGKGTGLGLATVLGIVRGHGGFVRVNSHVGHGTAFELYLPASPKEKTAEKAGSENLPPAMHGELILVVDDETSVRNVIQRTLDKHGYQVATAAEGSEAMAFYAQHRAEIKAVITDLMMPGMDGPSLIRALRHLDPRLPILSMTGMGEQMDIKGIQSLGLPVLQKPFVRGELLAALHQAIAAAAEPGRTAK
jgi:PAS domain S-box-containing protein